MVIGIYKTLITLVFPVLKSDLYQKTAADGQRTSGAFQRAAGAVQTPAPRRKTLLDARRVGRRGGVDAAAD